MHMYEYTFVHVCECEAVDLKRYIKRRNQPVSQPAAKWSGTHTCSTPHYTTNSLYTHKNTPARSKDRMIESKRVRKRYKDENGNLSQRRHKCRRREKNDTVRSLNSTVMKAIVRLNSKQYIYVCCDDDEEEEEAKERKTHHISGGVVRVPVSVHCWA